MSFRGKDSKSKGKTRNYQAIAEENDVLDLKFGFARAFQGASFGSKSRFGWLFNYLPITVLDETGTLKSGLDLYFIDREGENFKCSILYEPYFYISLFNEDRILEVSRIVQRIVEKCRIEVVEKEDLEMPNHLSGKRSRLLKILFNTVDDLVEGRSILRYLS